MSESPLSHDLVKILKAEKLKPLGLEAADYIGNMPVLVGKAFLGDSRKANQYAQIPIRIVLGDDSLLPHPGTEAGNYPETSEMSTISLSNMLSEALARVVMLHEYSPERDPDTPHFQANELIRRIIDVGEKADNQKLPSPLTVITGEGAIWKDGKHIVGDFKETYYTENVFEQLMARFYKDYPLTPIFLLAACNKDKNGNHADVKPPKGVDLVYTNGLASILFPGQPVFKYTENK